MRKGLACPNRVWEAWTDEEVQAIIDLQPAVVQVNIYEQQPESVRDAQRQQCWYIWRAIQCQFQYRMMGWHDMLECAGAALMLTRYPDGSIIPFNEPNIPLEGWGGIEYVQAAKNFAIEYKRLGGGRQLITPAMSPSADGYFSGTDAMIQLVREGLYDYLGLHEYLNQIFTPIEVPVCITECNGKVPSQVFDYLARLYPTAEAAIWFSSKWIGAEDPNYHWDLIGNEELSASFVSWQGGTMTYYRPIVWANYQRKLAETPMFQKVRAAHPELGDALGPEYDVEPYRLQDYAGGIIYARIGDWQHYSIAHIENELPPA